MGWSFYLTTFSGRIFHLALIAIFRAAGRGGGFSSEFLVGVPNPVPISDQKIPTIGFNEKTPGYSSEFSVGVCRPLLQILTLFEAKTFHFPHPFSDLPSLKNKNAFILPHILYIFHFKVFTKLSYCNRQGDLKQAQLSFCKNPP